jgi:hypothetical protein
MGVCAFEWSRVANAFEEDRRKPASSKLSSATRPDKGCIIRDLLTANATLPWARRAEFGNALAPERASGVSSHAQSGQALDTAAGFY